MPHQPEPLLAVAKRHGTLLVQKCRDFGFRQSSRRLPAQALGSCRQQCRRIEHITGSRVQLQPEIVLQSWSGRPTVQSAIVPCAL